MDAPLALRAAPAPPADSPEHPVVRVALLGTLRVVSAGRALEASDFPGSKPRELLQALLCQRGHRVSKDRLAELLWGDELPRDHAATLETYVSVLRRTLAPHAPARESVVVTERGGYRIGPERPGGRPRRLRRAGARARQAHRRRRRWACCSRRSRSCAGTCSRTHPRRRGRHRSRETYRARWVQVLVDAGRLALRDRGRAGRALATRSRRVSPGPVVGTALPGPHDGGVRARPAVRGARGLRAVPPAARGRARRRPARRDGRPAPGDPASRDDRRAAPGRPRSAPATERRAGPAPRRRPARTRARAGRAGGGGGPGARRPLHRRRRQRQHRAWARPGWSSSWSPRPGSPAAANRCSDLEQDFPYLALTMALDGAPAVPATSLPGIEALVQRVEQLPPFDAATGLGLMESLRARPVHDRAAARVARRRAVGRPRDRDDPALPAAPLPRRTRARRAHLRPLPPRRPRRCGGCSVDVRLDLSPLPAECVVRTRPPRAARR